MLHKLLIAVFNTAQRLKMLKEEVKLFNKRLKLVTESVWLLTEKNKQKENVFFSNNYICHLRSTKSSEN